MLEELTDTSQNPQCKSSIILVILGQIAAAAALVPRKLQGFPGPPGVCWGQGLVQHAPEGLHSGVWLQLWRGCALSTCSVWRFHGSWSWPQSLHTHRRHGKGECWEYFKVCFLLLNSWPVGLWVVTLYSVRVLNFFVSFINLFFFTLYIIWGWM